MSGLFGVTLFIGAAFVADGSEITWGDVAMDGSLTIRSLDIPIAIARGLENFFAVDPMEAHDWIHVRTLNKSMAAHIALEDVGSKRLLEMERALAPLYKVMPKNTEGRLSNGTVRYALHRFFRAKHGWSVKGLEPAAGSWIKSMSVTPDVKDMSKYMMPSYLQHVLMRDTGSKSLDLKKLAVLAATFEHVVHVEMISILYSVYATLELSTAEKKSGRELDDILDAYMIVYAFGVNTDVTTSKQMAQAKRHLEENHMGWPRMQEFVRRIAREVASSVDGGNDGLYFDQVLAATRRIGDEYVHFQSQDCARAKDELLRQPRLANGKVPLGDVRVSRADGYRDLFTETTEDLTMYGVVDQTSTRDPTGELIVPNYIASNAMCLSTASYYTACCPNVCEDHLDTLEKALEAPSATPEQILDVLQALVDKTSFLKDMQKNAVDSNGQVSLHSNAFAHAMHRAFPNECPQPSKQRTTNPKTPDEWMEEPPETIQDTDELLREISNVLGRYTAMSVSPDYSQVEEEVQRDDDVVRVVDTMPKPVDVAGAAKAIGRTGFFLALAASMLGFAAKLSKSGVVASCSIEPDKCAIESVA